jgi:hypothetical protein
VGAVCGRGRGTKIKTKANRCGACYYSIVLNAHRVTSMADTDIDAVRKQKMEDGRYTVTFFIKASVIGTLLYVFWDCL